MSNKNHQLTIYHADTSGNRQNCFYPHEVQVTDMETLRHALSCDHVFAKYRDNRRSNENFQYADFLVLDCDNDHSDEEAAWIRPEDLADILPDVKFITYSSRHDNIAKDAASPRPRFHVIFPIARTESAEEYAGLKKKTAELLPFFDGNALDAGRFFFGVSNPKLYAHQGGKDLTEWLQEERDTDTSPDAVIPEGKRNSALSKIAGRLVKRYGDTEEAHATFLREAARCSPPLPEREVSRIWKSAQKYYLAVSAQPGYIPPEQYGRAKAPAWEEPVPLSDVEDLPVFPTHTLPPVIAAYVKAVAESLQIPEDMAASCALGVLSTCLQRKFAVRINPDWTEPINLYILIVAEPSERKSPCIKQMCFPIEKYEDGWNREHAAAIRGSQEMKAALVIGVENLRKAVARGKATEEELQEAVERELAYKPQREKRLYLDDVTPEKLVSEMADNGGACSIISSEGGVFDIFAGRYSGSANIDVLLKAYSGDTIKKDRSTKRSECILSPALTILDMMQPNALAGIMNNKVFRERGLTARILFCIPKSKIGYRDSQAAAVLEEIREAYEKLIINLLNMENRQTVRISLSEEAERERIAFDREVEKKQLDEFVDFRDWAGKIVGTTIRIAALLCLASEAEQGAVKGNEPLHCEISGENMRNAILIARYYMKHMIAAYRNAGLETLTKNCKRALASLIRHNCSDFTVRDLMRSCKFRTAELAQTVIDHLEDLGYVKPLDPEPYRKPGKPSRSRYSVNPLLQEEWSGA